MKRQSYLLAVLLLAVTALYSQGEKNDELQRQSTGVFDQQENTESNIEFSTTNYGIWGHNASSGKGSVYWPRGSGNQYIFGSGIWFGAKKENSHGELSAPLVFITYNPNTGDSWAVPGHVSDGDKVNLNDEKLYRSYYSTDFHQYNGVPYFPEDGPNWSLWITDTTLKYEYGTYKHEYVTDVSMRNRQDYPYGPLFVSDEDIVSTYKDTDLDYYEGGIEKRESEGYPLGLQITEKIYSWGEGELQDIMIISYEIENVSDNNLKDCYVAGVFDVDIAHISNLASGAGNDRFTYFFEEEKLNMAYAWTQTDRGEEGKGFGYLGIQALETPAIDASGYIRNDKLLFEPDEQIGLGRFDNWTIVDDFFENQERYEFMQSHERDGDTGPGDNRMLLSSGKFNMRPGDKARIVFALNFSMPAKGGEADGTYEDITGLQPGGTEPMQAKKNTLIGTQQLVKQVYYNNGTINSVDKVFANLTKSVEVYPNPVKSNINLSFELEEAKSLEISIVDINGNKVQQLYSGILSDGQQNMSFNIGNKLASGSYYLRFKSGNSISSTKIVVVN